jgi:molecular chaperone DnaK (HSP70)
MKYLAIDFGTTNTAVAFFDETEKKLITIPYHGPASLTFKKSLPSVVGFDEEGKPKFFGHAALTYGKNKPHLCIDKIKRVIGKTYEDAKKDPLLKNVAYELVKGDLISKKGEKDEHIALVRVGEIEKQTYTSEEIASMILKQAKQDAETYLEQEKGYTNLKFDAIILTFPANFSINQRDKIKEAAVIAGFEKSKIQVINEPIAAAFDAVFCGKITSKKEDILVLNIGSGTTDVAVVELRLKEGKTQANAWGTGGDSVLGGTDMDIAIVDWVISQLKKDPNIESESLTKAGRQLLRFSVEDAKIAISEGKVQETNILIPGCAEGPLLTRNEFINIVKPIVDRCRSQIKTILAERRINDESFSRIILTGGPMLMPIVKEMVVDEFGDRVIEGVDPMMCVARGAAISPTITYTTTLPNAIKLLVKGERTPPKIKTVIDLHKQLPANVSETWTIEPWESNLTIQVLQDISGETKYNAERDEYYGKYNYWGEYSYALKPSKETRSFSMGLAVNVEIDHVEAFIFESESELATWLVDPEKYTGTPLKVAARRYPITIDGFEELYPAPPNQDRVWAAIRYRAPTIMKTIFETYNLCNSVMSLQNAGYKISEEISGLVGKTQNLLKIIYGLVSSEVDRISKLDLSETKLDEQVDTAVKRILASSQYMDLSQLMTQDWETNMEHLAITTESVAQLCSNIDTIFKIAEQLWHDQGSKISDKDQAIIDNLRNKLTSDLKFFEHFSNGRKSILLKSTPGNRFIDSKNRVEILKSHIAFYAQGNYKPDNQKKYTEEELIRSRESPEGASAEAPRNIVDSVHFSVISQSQVCAGMSFVVDIWAHLGEEREEVIRRAQEAMPEVKLFVKSKGPVSVSRGTILTVRLKIDSLVVENWEDTIMWKNEIGNANFRVTVPKETSIGSKPGIATIHANGFQIARIYFSIQIGTETSRVEKIETNIQQNRKAFASYASEDRDYVLACIQIMQKFSPQLDVDMDLKIRSGQYWEKELWRLIPSKDVFYLFWSSNSAKSDWVEKEWRCALEKRGLDFIDPVALVDPELVPPPPELSSKQFNDWTTSFMRGRRQ